MGSHEGLSQPDVFYPNGLLPDEAASVTRVLDLERWAIAEERIDELIGSIQPNKPSEDKRNAFANYVQQLITKCFSSDPPRKDGGDLLLNKVFLRACSTVYSVFPGGQENNELPFIPKHFNVIDPLRANNNLGRSVNGSSDVTNPLNNKKIQSVGREVKLQKSSHSSNGILPQKGNHVFKTNSRTNNNTSRLQSQKTSANLTYSVASNQSNHIPQSLQESRAHGKQSELKVSV
ncbi:hypothetical protein POM88_018818 [Heracleum sosnowskyi]|uniref:PAP/OAS1 substrate-binding-related domain-containing protein n=1 Tax=Heracleum sosnowskyi TaxID=360622 RepID=A0AAD8IV36_9APIA|nr:hypothetical protein POM88_018818 [Heracleum sosnowskyi]